jgi:hypothetical protein
MYSLKPNQRDVAMRDKSCFHYKLTYTFIKLFKFCFLLNIEYVLLNPLFRTRAIKKYLNKPEYLTLKIKAENGY